MLVLVLEASTSSAKAMLYDSDQGILAVEAENYPAGTDDGGRQNTEAVFLATIECGRRIAAGKDIAAVAVGAVWHSIAILDGNMRPQTPTYTWTFTGASDICRSIRRDQRLANHLYARTGCMPNVTYQPYTLRYLASEGLTLSDKLFTSQGGYNFYRLTGERLETACIASGMGLLNTKELRYEKMAMELAGIREYQLSPLGTYRDTRPLSFQGANLLGISPGIPVVPPHADGALNQVGNGALRPGAMTFSVGTSAAIRLSVDRPILSDPPGTWCYVGAEGWMCGAATAGACNCVKWFKKSMLKNAWSYRELEETLLDSGQTPIFLPFLFGERCPGWQDERLGCFFGLSGEDSSAALFQSICEGVLYNVYQCYRILTELAGVPDEIILSGGILNSPKWTQLCADIWEHKLILSDTPQASLLGGAVLALHAAGALDDIRSFTCAGDGTVSPRHETAARYRQKYEQFLYWYELCNPDATRKGGTR